MTRSPGLEVLGHRVCRAFLLAVAIVVAAPPYVSGQDWSQDQETELQRLLAEKQAALAGDRLRRESVQPSIVTEGNSILLSAGTGGSVALEYTGAAGGVVVREKTTVSDIVQGLAAKADAAKVAEDATRLEAMLRGEIEIAAASSLSSAEASRTKALANVQSSLVGKLEDKKEAKTSRDLLRDLLRKELKVVADDVKVVKGDVVAMQRELTGKAEAATVKKDMATLEAELQDKIESVAEEDVVDCTSTKYEGPIEPPSSLKLSATHVSCEHRGSVGVIVVQRRVSNSIDFYKHYDDYSYGFGEIHGNYWLGLDDMHKITTDDKVKGKSTPKYGLLFELIDHQNKIYKAYYDNVRISDRDSGYKLTYSSYNKAASDLCDHMGGHANRAFSTYNHGPSQGCAHSYKGGWWYTGCHSVNINGRYHDGSHGSYADGINWNCVKGYHYSFKASRMMLYDQRNMPKY